MNQNEQIESMDINDAMNEVASRYGIDTSNLQTDDSFLFSSEEQSE